mgnify:CR=1 FL=1
MSRYTKTMAEAYKEVKEIAPAIAGLARAAASGAGAAVANRAMDKMNASKKKIKEDPVAKAQVRLDKAKKIADLKKQISDIRKEAIEPAGDDDHEVSMARGELEAIADKALELSSAMQGMTDEGNPLEAWVQSKITKAKDYINSAYDYLMYNPDIAKEDMDMDPAKHVARSKRNPDKFCVFDKDGNEVKLFDKEADAVAYAKANHDKLMEELNEFTDAQIARLKKEYEPLKGKETGIALNKFDKLRKILKRLQKPQLLKLVKADLPIVSSAAKARLVINHGMKWSQLPEELVPYIDVDMLEEQKSKFKSVDPKVLARISKMMRGSTEEKKSLANLMNYLMPPEVVDMVRDKFGIKMPRGKIKFTDL